MKVTDRDEFISKFKVPVFNNNNNFWLIRSKGGAFFEEFIEKGFMGIGWNPITKESLDKYSDDEKQLLETIKDEYKDLASIKGAWKKCEHFIYDVAEGDIAIIPNKGSSKIAIVKIGEYYEDVSLTQKKEIEVLQQIKEGWDGVIRIDCPYRKRRKIEVIKVIEGKEINPNLYKALISYHGISKINDYGEFILNTIYPIYVINNKLNLVFNVEQENPISAVSFSGFIYNFTQIMSNAVDPDSISTKSNVNSPGDLILSIIQDSDSIINSLQYILPWVGLIWIALVGGKWKDYEINSLVELIIKWQEHKQDMELKEIAIEKARYELEKQKINDRLASISESAQRLEVKKDDIENVIDVDYHED